MLRIAHDRWNQTEDDLRALAVGAPHARTRERFLTLYQVTQGWSAAAWASEIGRRHATVLEWIHAYNERGPEVLTYRRTGGWPLFFPEVASFVGDLIAQATQAAATPRSVKPTVAEAQVPEPLVGAMGGEHADTVAAPQQPPCSAEGTCAPPPIRAPNPVPPTPKEMSTPHKPEGWVRWTLRRLAKAVEDKFGRKVSRETLRRVLHKAHLSWKKAKKIFGRADPGKREAFLRDMRTLLDRVLHDEALVLAYIDEAHIHQDADLGYGWSPRGERLSVASSSPGLKAKVSFYGIYVYSEPAVHIWPYDRANGVLTVEVLQRLRRAYGTRPLTVVWDGASYHRCAIVGAAAERLGITLVRLPPYSPDFMPVEALWHWLREEVTYNVCHDTPGELIERVERFVQRISRDICALADRLWVKDELDPEQEKLRFSS